MALDDPWYVGVSATNVPERVCFSSGQHQGGQAPVRGDGMQRSASQPGPSAGRCAGRRGRNRRPPLPV